MAPRRLGVRAEALVIAPYADTKQLSWVKTLDEPLQKDDRGRAALPTAAFEAAAFAVVDGAAPEEPSSSIVAPEEPTSSSAVPEEPTGSKTAARAATWTRYVAEGPGPPGRVPAATCTTGGGLFIFGGETDAPPWSPIPNRYLNDVWRLDLRSGRWEELSPDGAPGAPDPRVCASAVASDAGELVVYGGIRRRGGEHETMGDLWTFSTTTKRWTKTEASGAAPGPLAGHAAARVKGDCAIVYGGAHPEAALSDETYLLDLKTKAWTRRAPGPAARDFHVLLSSPDGVLMWGGADDGVWRYCVETDAWTKDADLPYLSGRSGVVLNDGSVVSVGGMSLVDRVAQYDAEVLMRSSGAAFRAVDAAADAPPGRCFPALAAAPDGSVLMFGGYRRIDGETQERLGDVWKLELRPAPPRTMTPPFD